MVNEDDSRSHLEGDILVSVPSTTGANDQTKGADTADHAIGGSKVFGIRAILTRFDRKAAMSPVIGVIGPTLVLSDN